MSTPKNLVTMKLLTVDEWKNLKETTLPTKNTTSEIIKVIRRPLQQQSLLRNNLMKSEKASEHVSFYEERFRYDDPSKIQESVIKSVVKVNDVEDAKQVNKIAKTISKVESVEEIKNQEEDRTKKTELEEADQEVNELETENYDKNEANNEISNSYIEDFDLTQMEEKMTEKNTENQDLLLTESNEDIVEVITVNDIANQEDALSDKNNGEIVETKNKGGRPPYISPNDVLNVMLKFDLFNSDGVLKSCKDKVWGMIRSALKARKLAQSFYLDFRKNKNNILNAYIKQKSIMPRLNPKDVKLLKRRKKKPIKQPERKQKGGRKTGLTPEETLKILLEFDILNEEGLVRRAKDEVWSKIRDRMGATKLPKSIYMDIQQNRNNFFSDYIKAKNISLMPIMESVPDETEIETSQEEQNSEDNKSNEEIVVPAEEGASVERPTIVTREEVLRTFLQFDLFSADGVLKRPSDSVWKKICYQLDVDKDPKSFYFDMKNNRKNLFQDYVTEKGITIAESNQTSNTSTPLKRIKFDIIIPREKWNKIKPVLKQYASGKSSVVLNKNWTHVVAKSIWHHQKLPCCWRFIRNTVCEHYQDIMEPYIKIKGDCSECSARIIGECKEKPGPYEDAVFTIKTVDTYGIPHTKKRKLSAEERTQAEKELMTMKPEEWLEKLRAEEMKEGDPEPAHIPKIHTIKKARHEGIQKSRGYCGPVEESEDCFPKVFEIPDTVPQPIERHVLRSSVQTSNPLELSNKCNTSQKVVVYNSNSKSYVTLDVKNPIIAPANTIQQQNQNFMSFSSSYASSSVIQDSNPNVICEEIGTPSYHNSIIATSELDNRDIFMNQSKDPDVLYQSMKHIIEPEDFYKELMIENFRNFETHHYYTEYLNSLFANAGFDSGEFTPLEIRALLFFLYTNNELNNILNDQLYITLDSIKFLHGKTKALYERFFTETFKKGYLNTLTLLQMDQQEKKNIYYVLRNVYTKSSLPS